MEHSITEQRREEIWEALSDVFVDNEINFKWIAEQVSDITPSEIERIFFEEVAPYCGGNLLTHIPSVWSRFAREELITGIHAMLKRNASSSIARLKHRLYVMFLRRNFKDDWQKLENYLNSSYEPLGDKR